MQLTLNRSCSKIHVVMNSRFVDPKMPQLPIPGDTSFPSVAARRHGQWAQVFLLPLFLMLLCLAFRAFGPTTARARGDASAVTAATAAGASIAAGAGGLSDDRIRERILGAWGRKYSGDWRMEIRPDGTGAMTVIPDRVWSYVVGARVSVEFVWRVEDGMAIFDTLRGEPETSYRVVMTMWKKHQRRKVLQLNEQTFAYLSDDGVSRSEWTRVVE